MVTNNDGSTPNGYDVFMILVALFAQTDAHSIGLDGVRVPFLTSLTQAGKTNYKFSFSQQVFRSDSLEELSEIAIREVDSYVRKRVDKTERPYITLDVSQAAAAFQSLFVTSPDNPKQIDLYVDSFRKGIALYRASRNLKGVS